MAVSHIFGCEKAGSSGCEDEADHWRLGQCFAYPERRAISHLSLGFFAVSRNPFDASQHLGGLHARHLQIYKDLKQFYWDIGLSTAQLEITRKIIAGRTAFARENFDELTLLRALILATT